MAEDYTYDAVPTFPDRVNGILAKQQAQIDAQAQQIHRLIQHQTHTDIWIHKLLNPDGDVSPTESLPLYDYDHADVANE